MTLVDKFKEVIGEGAPEPLALPDAMVFSQLDANSLMKRLDVIQKAKNNGLNNQPNTKNIEPDSVEEEIHETVLAEIRSNLQNNDSQQQAYSNRLNFLDFTDSSARIRGEAAFKKNQLKTKIDQEQGDLFLIKRDLVAVEHDWENFKKKWSEMMADD